jgi:uncharacterized protein
MTAAKQKETLKQVKEMAAFIKERFKAKDVILFGSYAYGKPDRDSDVDLMVILRALRGKSYKKATEIRLALDTRFDINFPMDMLVRTNEQFKDKKDDYFFREVREKGKYL